MKLLDSGFIPIVRVLKVFSINQGLLVLKSGEFKDFQMIGSDQSNPMGCREGSLNQKPDKSIDS